jgi:ribonuclease HII
MSDSLKPKEEQEEQEQEEKKQNKYGLSFCYDSENDIEIGIDEAGRGPLFGRLYVAGVILPKDGSFDYSEIRDSKKITSKTKISKLAEYIKQKSIAWYIHFIEAEEIDEINIRQAVLKAMRECIRVLLEKKEEKTKQICLLIDGNDFPPYNQYDTTTNKLVNIPHVTIPGGDNLFVAIACASILAKTARDEYILELCEQYPFLKTNYGIEKNMGYGTKTHLEGIHTHGITEWHRKTYGICKTYGM